ncbi:hypothetical protein BC835DRAFT_1329939 [Cytidiella melzeri]|nr:hypothetical protein BC835DRAFT_1329939 [Cytidiella melzeri]
MTSLKPLGSVLDIPMWTPMVALDSDDELDRVPSATMTKKWFISPEDTTESSFTVKTPLSPSYTANPLQHNNKITLPQAMPAGTPVLYDTQSPQPKNTAQTHQNSLAEVMSQSFQQNSQTAGILKPAKAKRPHTPAPSLKIITSTHTSKAPSPLSSALQTGSGRHQRKLRQLHSRDQDWTVRSDKVLDRGLDTHVLPFQIDPHVSIDAPILSHNQEIVLLMQAARWQADSAANAKGKGKERREAWKGYMTPRYSEAGMFKHHLDNLFGPGDMLRGFGKEPSKRQSSEDKDDWEMEVDDSQQGDSTDGEAAKMEVIRRRRQIG